MEDRTDLVPYRRFNSADLPVDQRRQAWRDNLAGQQRVTPLDEDDKIRSESHGWIIGDLVVGWASFSAQRMVRQHGREIGKDTRRHLFLTQYLDGSSHFVHDGHVINMHPGGIHLLNYELECSSVSTGGRVNCVVIPYETIGYDPGLHPPRLSLDIHSTTGRLLSKTVAALLDNAPTTKLSDAPGAAAFLVGMLTELLQANLPVPCQSTHCAGQDIRDYVIQHAHTCDLTVDTLIERFATSRATLYRHFKMYGGLKSFIEKQRMDMALRHLTCGPRHRGRITEVAEATGYRSVRRFSSAFARRFGLTPSEVLGNSPTQTSSTNQFTNTLWQTWNNRSTTASD